MRYCRALRERKATAQAAVLRGMGVDAADIREQKPLAGVLKPSYVIVRDRQLHAIVLAIRGTHSLKVGAATCRCEPRRMCAWKGTAIPVQFACLTAGRNIWNYNFDAHGNRSTQ